MSGCSPRWRSDVVDVGDPALAMDLERAERLRALGQRVWLASIPEEVSPKDRLLLAAPASGPA